MGARTRAGSGASVLVRALLGLGGLVCGEDVDDLLVGEVKVAQAADVVAGLLVAAGAAGGVVRAEVGVAGGGVVEQVPDRG